MRSFERTTLVLISAAALVACSDGVGLNSGFNTTVEGRVEETTPPAMSPAMTGSPQSAPGTLAHTVAVVQVQADGSLTELATADVGTDGTFVVEGVPAGRVDLEVVAYVDGRVAGQVLIHERSRPGATIVAAPINFETTLEARAYSELRASGTGGGSIGSELALFLQIDGAAAQIAATSDAEVDAAAAAYVAASSTMTALYDAGGADLDAAARAEVVADAAVAFASNRNGGMSLHAAHDLFVEAAFEALLEAGASLESTVLATAAAATTFDAALSGQSSVRSELVSQPARMNLRAREHLAASFAASSAGSISIAIEQALVQGRLTLSSMPDVVDLQAVFEAVVDDAATAAADGAVELLAPNASTVVRAEVRARAEEALAAAQLAVRLQGVTTVSGAAAATSGYRASVRAAVDAMVAASGSTSVDANALTSLFISACGSAYIS